jgi:hypothetical protein
MPAAPPSLGRRWAEGTTQVLCTLATATTTGRASMAHVRPRAGTCRSSTCGTARAPRWASITASTARRQTRRRPACTRTTSSCSVCSTRSRRTTRPLRSSSSGRRTACTLPTRCRQLTCGASPSSTRSSAGSTPPWSRTRTTWWPTSRPRCSARACGRAHSMSPCESPRALADRPHRPALPVSRPPF